MSTLYRCTGSHKPTLLGCTSVFTKCTEEHPPPSPWGEFKSNALTKTPHYLKKWSKIHFHYFINYHYTPGLLTPTLKLTQNVKKKTFLCVFGKFMNFYFFTPITHGVSPPQPKWCKTTFLCVLDNFNNFYFFTPMTSWGHPLTRALDPNSEIDPECPIYVFLTILITFTFLAKWPHGVAPWAQPWPHPPQFIN